MIKVKKLHFTSLFPVISSAQSISHKGFNNKPKCYSLCPGTESKGETIYHPDSLEPVPSTKNNDICYWDEGQTQTLYYRKSLSIKVFVLITGGQDWRIPLWMWQHQAFRFTLLLESLKTVSYIYSFYSKISIIEFITALINIKNQMVL